MSDLMGLIRASELSAKRGAKEYRAEIRRIDTLLRETQQIPKAERPRCGAQTRSGGLCVAPAVPGGQRCRMHGAGGFDSVEIRLIMLRNRRKELVKELRIMDAMAGRKPGKIPASVGRSLRKSLGYD